MCSDRNVRARSGRTAKEFRFYSPTWLCDDAGFITVKCQHCWQDYTLLFRNSVPKYHPECKRKLDIKRNGERKAARQAAGLPPEPVKRKLIPYAGAER